MMKLKNNVFAIWFLMMTIIVTGCSDDDDDNSSVAMMDIVELASDDTRFSTLVAAVSAADLVDTLQSDGPFTVFAPTDEAFTAYLEANDLTADELLASDQLADILTYHVFSGEVFSAAAIEIAQGSENVVTMVNGDSLALSLSGEDLYTNLSLVTDVDIDATNGVIHAIDAVLVPPVEEDNPTQDIVDIALADENFSTLVTALTTADLVSTLQGEGPFTVFAPTNAAFDKIPADTLNGLLADVDALTGVLTQHVVSGEVDSVTAMSLNGSAADTVSGNDISIDIVDGALVVQGATVTTIDIYATNGVIHVIDTVITETLE